MANKAIKGLTVEIGGDTTKLGKALDDIDKKGRDLSSELGQINRLLKFDPGNADLLTQKQKVLADAVSNTAKRLETLEEAERQAQEQFKQGKVSEEQVRALQREIIETTNRLDRYRKAADETADAVKNLGKGSDDAAEAIEDTADAADEAEKEADELGGSLDGGLSAGFAAVTAAATAAVGAIVGCVEASHEYRSAMGKLDTAFEDNNLTAEQAKGTYKELQSVLGDTDKAVEAAGHLAAMADSQEDLTEWSEILTGVYARFGDSLPVEGLAEASNETTRTGQVTGALADALNWAVEEGEDFGLVLKENIDFTELSAKELESLTDAQREEYDARKEQYDAINDYNKSIEEATTAEDKFNIALENCADEQERQQLITKTLTKLYGSAAKQYKETNKTVIEANKANEEWNATMAELGEEMAPTVTEVKKFGIELLKGAKEPLKDVATFITGKVLPAISSIGRWVSNNLPAIKAGLIGITAALVAYKTATIAAEVSQKGLKGAIMATEAAQKLLNLAQAATPWGLAAIAITGVVTALTAYAFATDESTKKTENLTAEERELVEAAKEADAALATQRENADQNAHGVEVQMGKVTDLKNELFGLVGALGKVEEKDRDRVNFILGELNDALGTEYKLVDGEIQRYGDLKNKIDEVIASKTANLLIEAHSESYAAALQEEAGLLQGLTLTQKDYEAQRVKAKEAAELAKQAELEALEAEKQYLIDGNSAVLESAYIRAAELQIAANEEKRILDEKKVAYDEAAAAYGANAETIMGYEEAQTAAAEGNYDRVQELLRGKSGGYSDHANAVDAATQRTLDTLYREAVNAGIEAKRTRENWEAGVEGYTAAMVQEAEKSYEEALNAYADAYADAEGVGEDIGGGLADGMEAKRTSVISKIKSIVSGIISAARTEADSHSPSRKMIDFGEDMGEGAEVGIENKTDDLLGTAKRQVQHLLRVYSDEGDKAPEAAARGVGATAQARALQQAQAANSLHGSKLDQILTAIKAGQVLTIDGKTLVGATADRTDTALGRKRELVARGAL